MERRVPEDLMKVLKAPEKEKGSPYLGFIGVFWGLLGLRDEGRLTGIILIF